MWYGAGKGMCMWFRVYRMNGCGLTWTVIMLHTYLVLMSVRQFFLLSKTMRIAPGKTGRQDDTDCTEDGQSVDNHAKKMAMTVLMTDYGLTRIVIRLLFLFCTVVSRIVFCFIGDVARYTGKKFNAI